jgi:hypothetical protein
MAGSRWRGDGPDKVKVEELVGPLRAVTSGRKWQYVGFTERAADAPIVGRRCSEIPLDVQACDESFSDHIEQGRVSEMSKSGVPGRQGGSDKSSCRMLYDLGVENVTFGT